MVLKKNKEKSFNVPENYCHKFFNCSVAIIKKIRGDRINLPTNI